MCDGVEATDRIRNLEGVCDGVGVYDDECDGAAPVESDDDADDDPDGDADSCPMSTPTPRASRTASRTTSATPARTLKVVADAADRATNATTSTGSREPTFAA